MVSETKRKSFPMPPDYRWRSCVLDRLKNLLRMKVHVETSRVEDCHNVGKVRPSTLICAPQHAQKATISIRSPQRYVGLMNAGAAKTRVLKVRELCGERLFQILGFNLHVENVHRWKC